MTDVISEQPDFNKSIVDSKLYTLARSTPVLSFLIPDFPTQMSVEAQVDSDFAREASDEDHTRILINYTNNSGNSTLFNQNDAERLQRKFDLDHFMNRFMLSVENNVDTDDPLEKANFSVLAALNMAVTTVIRLNDGPEVTDAIRHLSTVLLCSITAVLFNDALDIMVLVNDRKNASDGGMESVITGLWVVKKRPVIDENVTEPVS